MKDFDTTHRPENTQNDPAATYRKQLSFITRRPNASGKDEATLRLVGGIKLAAQYWFSQSGGKSFAITTPFFDEDNETFIPRVCPLFDRGIVRPRLVWAMNAINRYKQQEEHNPKPIEVFPANKTEFSQLKDLYEEHGPPNSIEHGYDIVSRKWKDGTKRLCNVTVKMQMKGASLTPLTEVEKAYPLWDLNLLYQPREHANYLIDVIRACLFDPKLTMYGPEEFKQDFEKYLPKDEQPKHVGAYEGILKRYHEMHAEEGDSPQDARAPAMMTPGAPMANTPMQQAPPASAQPAPPPVASPPVPPPQATQPMPTTPTTPPSVTTPMPSSPAPPPAGTMPASEPPKPPPPAPSSMPTPPASTGTLNVPTPINPSSPPAGMPNPATLMNSLAPKPPGGLGAIDDDD